MSEIKANKQQKESHSMRVVVLLAQILIPFGLYWAMTCASPLWMGICAAAYVFCMGVLVWLK